jgi:hypothetical protein
MTSQDVGFDLDVSRRERNKIKNQINTYSFRLLCYFLGQLAIIVGDLI